MSKKINSTKKPTFAELQKRIEEASMRLAFEANELDLDDRTFNSLTEILLILQGSSTNFNKFVLAWKKKYRR